jgi:eukaryotic-like serine/threonine-protein kinase
MGPGDDISNGARATPALAPGTVVGGRFEIREPLGTGGMGLVYSAFDRSLDQLVALKMLHADLEPDPALLARFRDEVKLARLITHPSVCRLHDLEEADGHHFLTMELLDGETLAARLARERRLPVAEVARIGRGIAAGLGAAHVVGVLHLDLKPGNVMLERGGRVVVMDFGLARALGEAPGRGVVAGTVAYMAPEQFAGRPLEPRVDIYSLGLVLYEMACGVVPGLGATAAATAQARLEGEPPDPRALRPDLPEKLRRAIRKCLAPRPADRYANVEEVWRELDTSGSGSWLAEVSGHFTRPRVELPEAPRPRRRALLVAAAVVVAAGAALLWTQRPRVLEVPRVAVLVDEPPAGAAPSEIRLRRAAQRLVARELVERGVAAAAEARPGSGVAAVQVRLLRAPGGFTIDASLTEGRARRTHTTPAPTLAAAAARTATALTTLVRTVPAALDPRTLEATGTTSPAAAREVALAQAAVSRLDREAARRHAARALELEPGLVAPHLARAGVEEACTDASRGHLRRAREAARGRTDLPSRLAEAWARYEVDADDAGGLAALAALYAAHPGDPDVAYQYANALGDVWRVEKANAILERLLEAHPAHVPAMLRLFDLRINNAEIAQLLKDGARLIEQAPEEPQAYVILGRTLLAAGRFAEALAAFDEALTLDPGHDLALIFAGRTKFYQGDVEGGRVLARRLLSSGDARRRAAGLRNLGLADILDGRFADGLRQLEESLRVSPDDATDGNYIHKVLVYTYKDLGELEAALAAAGRWRQHAAKATFWAQIAYARQEEDAFRLRLGRMSPGEFRLQLSVYLAELKKVAGPDVIAGQGPKLVMWHSVALGEYREALLAALKDESPSCYNQFLIAESYARLGEHEKAVEWYRRLLTKPDEEIIPTLLVRTRLRLGDALTELGRHEEARAEYAKFLAAWGKADRPLPDVERARQRLGTAP